ncbi:MAG: hypothetical protein HYV09_28915 [Deltaproteobacteria bacterium]|nr:hypothetical protein [Deltaproteobacteria bacterium]
MLYRLPPPPADLVVPRSLPAPRLPMPRPGPRTIPPPRPAPAHPALARPAAKLETLWDVADIDGKVLASRITLSQLRARVENGLLEGAALAAKSDDREFRPLSDVLGGSGARRISRYWYLTRSGGDTIGPVETTLVERGIVAGKVPLDSLVCEVGEDYWVALKDAETFAGAIHESLFDDEVTSSIEVSGGWYGTG